MARQDHDHPVQFLVGPQAALAILVAYGVALPLYDSQQHLSV